ncbi:MAG TPA: hypothetical protein PKH26_08210 [Phycisphaerae bacterium]|nr:hypothetical protein [Phycisphaerae bacterium]
MDTQRTMLLILCLAGVGLLALGAGSPQEQSSPEPGELRATDVGRAEAFAGETGGGDVMAPEPFVIDCTNTAGCGVASMADCRWSFFPNLGDPVEVRMASLGITLDGDLRPEFNSGACVYLASCPGGCPPHAFVAQCPDQACAVGHIDRLPISPDPGPDGWLEPPYSIDAPSGFNVGCSLMWFAPDDDPLDGVDTSFLYVGWDVADPVVNRPRQYDGDYDGSACTATELGTLVDEGAEEFYEVYLRACSDLSTYDPLVRDTNSVSSVPDTLVHMRVQETGVIFNRSPLVTRHDSVLPDSDFLSFPTADGVTNPRNVCIDQEITYCAGKCNVSGTPCVLGAPGGCPVGETCELQNNVELVVKRVETSGLFGPYLAPAVVVPDSDEARANRFAIAELVALLRGDNQSDDKDEESALVARHQRLPEIEVKKQVRCRGEGEGAWRDAANVLPGGLVEFRIEIENTGNEDLDVTVTDVLSPLTPCVALTAINDPNRPAPLTPFEARLTSPRRGLANFLIDFPDDATDPQICNPVVDPENCLDEDFFDRTIGFIAGINADAPIHLGTLKGVKLLRNELTDACEVVEGDKIVLIVLAQVDVTDNECFCAEPRVDLDGRNAVTVSGTTLAQPNITPITVMDVSSDVDTYRELVWNGGNDDNVVTLDVLCREIDFVKEVGFPGEPGSFKTGDDALGLPSLPPGGGSLQIEFRYSGTNKGELPETFTVTDDYLCADIAATQAAFPGELNIVNCPLCPAGSVVLGPIAPGDPYTTSCVIEFTTQDALRYFLARDNTVHPDCNAETYPEDCYKNCASVSATAGGTSGICGTPGELPGESLATICNFQCQIEVTKRVWCVDNCDDRNQIGSVYDDTNDPMPILPGGCVVFEIEVENIAISPPVPVCRLQFQDLLSEVPGDIQVPDTATVELIGTGAGGTGSCPIPLGFGFNVSDVPFEWDPASCPAIFTNGTFDPGDRLKLRYCTCVSPTADPTNPDPLNTVTVLGAASCVGGPQYGCQDSALVGLDIKRLNATVTKEVSCDEPRLPDGTLNPAAVWASSVDAVPGALVAFKIEVCNDVTSEVDITHVSIVDVLGCVPWYVLGSVVADIDGTPATHCICTNPVGNCDQFADLTGLKDLTACKANGIAPGECLTITFEVLVPADAVSGTSCLNHVAVGWRSAELCSPPEYYGPAEAEATIYVKVPQPLECEKLVCADFNGDHVCDTALTTDLILPCDTVFPLRLMYDFKVTNPASSEVAYENVTICDADLIADATAAGCTINPCELLPIGCKDCGTLTPGQSCTAHCEIEVPTYTAWLIFAGLDADGSDDCYSNTMTGEGDYDDDLCQRGVDPPEPAECSARVCVTPPCEITVLKEVRCLYDCNPATPGPWVADPELLEVLPGACVEYRITVTNSSTDVDICALRFEDQMTCADNFTTTAGFGAVVTGPLVCNNTPGQWPWNATVVECVENPQNPQPLPPGGTQVITFRGDVKPAADPACDPVNTVTVECASCPLDGGDLAYCGDEATSHVGLDIKTCAIDVTKEVTCDDPTDSGAVWQHSVDALPGSEVCFRIQVANLGDVNITKVQIADTLCDNGSWYVAGSVTADIDGTPATNCICTNPAGNCDQFGDINGLKDLTPCKADGIAPGETLTIIFCVIVEETPNPCVNVATIGGLSDICAPAGPCDEDTDTATINVKVPEDLECEKKVCADFNGDHVCDTALTTDLILPCDTVFPLRLMYDFKVTNPASSEVAYENVTICDADLIADATAAGCTINPCELLPIGCKDCGTLTPGQSCTAHCEIEVPTYTAWLIFAGLDADGSDDCYSNTMTGEGDYDDELCQRGVNPPEPAECSARVCVTPPCALDVVKRVRCVNTCPNPTVFGTWVEDDKDPNNGVETLDVLPGACVQYEIEVTNAGTDPICRLRFTDVLTGIPGDITAPSAATVRLNGGACPIPPGFGFNVTGVPFEWNPASCPTAYPTGKLEPGQSLTLSFCTCLPVSANPAAPDPLNTVTVECATCPLPGGPQVFCGDDDTSQVALDIKTCAIDVTKEVTCDDPTDPGAVWQDSVDALPGAEVCFRNQVENLGDVNITKVQISDFLGCLPWYAVSSVTADIDGTDVTNCICTNPAGNCDQFSDINGLKDLTPCKADGIAPGETLTIIFCVIVDETPDPCVNEMTVGGFSDICGPAGPCDEDSDTATINVKVPAITCTKTVCPDFEPFADACEAAYPFQQDLVITTGDIVYPVRLKYRFTAKNEGETVLTNVVLCDLDFVQDVTASAPGVTFVTCDLDPITGCSADLGPLAVGSPEVELFCTIEVADQAAWDAFAKLDGVGCPLMPPGSEDRCYDNTATVQGMPEVAVDICPPDDVLPVEHDCSARVTIAPEPCTPPPCPPRVKVKFDIWNQNEVKFSGTEHCMWSWEQQWVTEYDVPNHFLWQYLQTTKGQARIDGVASQVCDDDPDHPSVDAPLLGVAMKLLTFEGGEVETAGTNMVGLGSEAGQVIWAFGGGGEPPPPSLPPAGVSGGGVGAISAYPMQDVLRDVWVLGPGGDEEPEGEGGAVPGEWPRPRSGGRANALGGGERTVLTRGQVTSKGSFLVFPKVEVKWNAAGRLVQETFVDLTNDYPGSVMVQMYFVNGDLCIWVDNAITLTGNEPAYWGVSTGWPKGVSPFPVLEPPCPDTDPENPGGRRMRGYIIAWAVDPVTMEEIRWNHLKGDVLIMNYDKGTAWEYNAWAFQTVATVAHGQPTGTPGQLNLDGNEYEQVPAMLLLDFYAPGAVLHSGPSKSVTVTDTDLTFWAAIKDFTTSGN